MSESNCAKCGITFVGKDIFQTFLERYGSVWKAARTARSCGWTRKEPKSFVINRVLVKSKSGDVHRCNNCGNVVPAHY